jgi:hypothetical protein
VEDGTILGQSGGFQRSKRIYFALPDGTSSYVEVPLTEFSRDNVEARIAQHVKAWAEVMNLSGPEVPSSP